MACSGLVTASLKSTVMEHNTRDNYILVQYKEHVKANYKEPTDGRFDDCTEEVSKDLVAEDDKDESEAGEEN